MTGSIPLARRLYRSHRLLFRSRGFFQVWLDGAVRPSHPLHRTPHGSVAENNFQSFSCLPTTNLNAAILALRVLAVKSSLQSEQKNIPAKVFKSSWPLKVLQMSQNPSFTPHLLSVASANVTFEIKQPTRTPFCYAITHTSHLPCSPDPRGQQEPH